MSPSKFRKLLPLLYHSINMSDFCYKLCSLRTEQITHKTYGASICGSLQVCSAKKGHSQSALGVVRACSEQKNGLETHRGVSYKHSFYDSINMFDLCYKHSKYWEKNTPNLLKYYNNFSRGILNVFNFLLIYSWALKCLKTLKINVWLTEDIFYEKLPNLQMISLKPGILDQNESKGCHNLEWMPVLCQIAPQVNKQGMTATEQQYN